MSLTTEWMSSHVETVRPHITSHHTLAPSPGDPPPPPCSVLRGLKRTLYGLLGTAHAILCPMRLQVRPFFATHGGPIILLQMDNELGGAKPDYIAFLARWGPYPICE